MMRMTPPPAATPIIKPVLVFFELLDAVFTVDGAGVDTLPADGEGDVSGEDCAGGDSITGLLEGPRAGGVDGGAGDVGEDETGAGVGLGGGTGGGLFGGGGGEDGDTTEGDGDNEGGGVGNEDGEVGLFVGLVGGGVAGGGEF